MDQTCEFMAGARLDTKDGCIEQAALAQRGCSASKSSSLEQRHAGHPRTCLRAQHLQSWLSTSRAIANDRVMRLEFLRSVSYARLGSQTAAKRPLRTPHAQNATACCSSETVDTLIATPCDLNISGF